MSLVLNGTTQYLKRTSTPITDVPVTISCWFQSDSVTASQALASLEDGVNEFYLLQAAGAIAGDPVRAMSYSGTWRVAATTTGYSAGTWTHALGIFAADNDRRAFISGGSKGTESTAEDVAAASYIMVGAYKASVPTGFFDGKLAELAMWNLALSDANAASLAAGVLPTAIEAANLIGYWPLFDDANDDKGTANLTEIGSPSYDTADHPESYVELAASGGGTGGGSAAMQIVKWRRIVHEGMTDTTLPGLTLTNTLNMPAAGTIGFSADVNLIAADDVLQIQSAKGTNRLTVLRVIPKGQYYNNGAGATQSALEFFGTDFLADATNYHRLQILAYEAGNPVVDIRTDANGTATAKALNIYTKGKTGQLYLTTDGDVGINTTAPDGKFEIKTSTTYGKQALAINQDDTDQAFIDFQGSIAADVTTNISTDVDQWTFAHMVRHEVNGTVEWSPTYTSGGTGNMTPGGGTGDSSITQRTGADYDYLVGSFTADATWRDLDLSAILPAGTKHFWCRTAINHTSTGKLFGFRENGQTGNSDIHWAVVHVAGINNYIDLGPIGVDANLKCEYYASSPAWALLSMVVTAYST